MPAPLTPSFLLSVTFAACLAAGLPLVEVFAQQPRNREGTATSGGRASTETKDSKQVSLPEEIDAKQTYLPVIVPDFETARKKDLEELDSVQARQTELLERHPAPHYLDHLMHDLHVERFFEPKLVSDHFDHPAGPMKTMTLRGIKDSPPFLHDGRLLTLDDTVEFFNLIQGLKLNKQAKADLVAFLKTL